MIRKHKPNKPASIFDGLSIVEMLLITIIPIVLTAMSYVILTDLLGFNWLITFAISVASMCALIGAVIFAVNYMLERD